jgi:hypothetical protein
MTIQTDALPIFQPHSLIEVKGFNVGFCSPSAGSIFANIYCFRLSKSL